ncbi:unnamed protein product, partial [Ectocarpus sp. 13 AM-2016]
VFAHKCNRCCVSLQKHVYSAHRMVWGREGVRLLPAVCAGSTPKELGGLIKLEDLRLYDNKLTGVIPNELGKLVRLRRLYLSGNGLTGSIPKELGGYSTWRTFSSTATSSP